MAKPFKGTITLGYQGFGTGLGTLPAANGKGGGAKNVLYIVWDDTGLAAWDTFGGIIATLT